MHDSKMLTEEEICSALEAYWQQSTGETAKARFFSDRHGNECFIINRGNFQHSIQALEAVNLALERRPIPLHSPFNVRKYGNQMKGTYDGPLSYLKGKTALLMNAMVAQFDDPGTYLAYGWHNFDVRDFKIEPKAPAFQALATMCDSRRNSQDKNLEWFDRWTDRIERMVKQFLPSGSGFDTGTELDLDESSELKLVFRTSFHHMDDQGGYDGWTVHQVIATPSLTHGFNLRITGRDRNGIKEYITQTFNEALSQEVPKYGWDD